MSNSNARDKQIPSVRSGDQITAAKWNEVVAEVNRRPYVPKFDDRAEGPRFVAVNNTGATIPAFGLIGVDYKAVSAFDDTAIQTTIVQDGTHTLLLTNGPYEIPDGALADLWTFDEPRSIRAASAVSTWPVGERVYLKAGTTEATDVVEGDPSVICLSDKDANDRIWAYSPFLGVNGASPGCKCCSHVTSGDLFHPDLPAGKNETVNAWTLASKASDVLQEIRIPNTAGTAVCVWPGGKPIVNYEATGDTFTIDVTADMTVLDNGGADVTSTATNKAADWTMDWSTSPPKVELTMDADYTPPS